MNLESSAFHILGAFGRAIGRVFLWFVIFLVVGFGATQGVAAAAGHQLGVFTYLGGAVVGIVLGYAAGLTVIVREVVSVLVNVYREVQKVAKGGETDIGKFVATIESTISGRK